MSMKGKRRRFLDWLLRRPRCIDMTHAMFLARCADGDMAEYEALLRRRHRRLNNAT